MPTPKYSFEEFVVRYKKSPFTPKLNHIFRKRFWCDFKYDPPRFKWPTINNFAVIFKMWVPIYSTPNEYSTKGMWCFPWQWYRLYYEHNINR